MAALSFFDWIGDPLGIGRERKCRMRDVPGLAAQMPHQAFTYHTEIQPKRVTLRTPDGQPLQIFALHRASATDSGTMLSEFLKQSLSNAPAARAQRSVHYPGDERHGHSIRSPLQNLGFHQARYTLYVTMSESQKGRKIAMTGRYDQAEMLAALWTLGANGKLMPTSHGILDRALHAMAPKLPQPLSTLKFSVTGVGLRCFELPDILLAAQEAMLTSEPNPTYLSTLVNLSKDEADVIAIRHGLSLNEARSIGKSLFDHASKIKDEGHRDRAFA